MKKNINYKIKNDNILKNFTPPHPLNTAVLFLVFNRLDTTKEVFQALRQAKPPRLYIGSDGSRPSKDGEIEKVNAVRDYILSNIDWDCNVKTLFRDNNLGCKMAVSGAIDWFFEQEEQGIILEDDCLPSQSFFWFCEELLERYRDEMRVGMISGDNFQNGTNRGDGDYYFSVYNHIWGWASWANRWKNYDVELNTISNPNFINKIFQNRNPRKYWKKIFKLMKNKLIDTWDYQWTFTLWNQNQLTIIPKVNMISNIGFGVDATHTSEDNEYSRLSTSNLILNNHPIQVKQNIEADDYTSKIMFKHINVIDRAVNKIKRLLK